jgi:hypothetical protein
MATTREASSDDARDFLRVLLRHACNAHCNPNSLRQRLVHAADHHEAHENDMNVAKAFCVRGCLQAERALAGAAGSELPSQSLHAAVVESSRIGMLRASAIDVLHRTRDQCAEECALECRRHGIPSEPAHFQGYDLLKCKHDCAGGCARYIDALKAAFK